MENFTLTSFSEFLDQLGNLPFKAKFRGEAKEFPSLKPKVARHANSLEEDWIRQPILKIEHDILELFRVHGASDLPPNADDWTLLALAQHHGLPTRLLDWTYNPAVALYFAVTAYPQEDGFLFMWNGSDFVETKQHPNPLEIDKVRIYIPTRLSPRISAQDSVFSVHPYPYSDFRICTLRWRIPANLKEEFKLRLDTLGIHKANLFPGLDGLCAWIQDIKGFNQNFI